MQKKPMSNLVCCCYGVCLADLPTLHYKESRLAREFNSYYRSGKSTSLVVSAVG